MNQHAWPAEPRRPKGLQGKGGGGTGPRNQLRGAVSRFIPARTRASGGIADRSAIARRAGHFLRLPGCLAGFGAQHFPGGTAAFPRSRRKLALPCASGSRKSRSKAVAGPFRLSGLFGPSFRADRRLLGELCGAGRWPSAIADTSFPFLFFFLSSFPFRLPPPSGGSVASRQRRRRLLRAAACFIPLHGPLNVVPARLALGFSTDSTNKVRYL